MDDQITLAWDMALLGALGGTLPDWTRTLVGRREGDPDRWRDILTAGFIVSAFGLAVLGFIVVLCLGATSPWSAIVTGAAAPALLSNAWGQRERQRSAQADSLAAPNLWQIVEARWRR